MHTGLVRSLMYRADMGENMKIQWTLAAILAASVAAGCSEQPAENSPNQDANVPVAAGDSTSGTASGPTAEAPFRDDNSGVRPTETPRTTRPAQGTRPSTPAAAPSGGSSASSTSVARP